MYLPRLLSDVARISLAQAVAALRLVNNDVTRLDHITDHQWQTLQVPPAEVDVIRQLARLVRHAMQPLDHTPIEGPDDVAALLFQQLAHQPQEHFVIVCLDARGRTSPRNIHTIYIGGQDSLHIEPRDVFRVAIQHGAASLILAHCHPSGDPAPTQEDQEITRNLVAVGDFLGVKVLDHLIIGRETYVSMASMEA